MQSVPFILGLLDGISERISCCVTGWSDVLDVVIRIEFQIESRTKSGILVSSKLLRGVSQNMSTWEGVESVGSNYTLSITVMFR